MARSFSTRLAAPLLLLAALACLPLLAPAAATLPQAADGPATPPVAKGQRVFICGHSCVLSRFTLHDARVLAIASGKTRPTITLVLQLEGTPAEPGPLLELKYLLVTGLHGGVSVKEDSQLKKKDTSGRRWILYDEFDVDEQRAFFVHSLLLADGYELVVRFHHLRVRRLDEVLIPPFELSEGERTWPLVQT